MAAGRIERRFASAHLVNVNGVRTGRDPFRISFQVDSDHYSGWRFHHNRIADLLLLGIDQIDFDRVTLRCGLTPYDVYHVGEYKDEEN
jgi:hypothetical protein